jgi:hypothetical protein
VKKEVQSVSGEKLLVKVNSVDVEETLAVLVLDAISYWILSRTVQNWNKTLRFFSLREEMNLLCSWMKWKLFQISESYGQ